jgi:ABC-2 type transport system permease protein
VKVLRDIWLVFQRHTLLMIRSPLWLFLGVAQPVVYLALFGPLLKPALASMGATSMTEAYRIYVPGMLVALALAGGLYAGFGLLAEIGSGVIVPGSPRSAGWRCCSGGPCGTWSPW